MSFETHTLKGFSFRELSVLDGLGLPEVKPMPDTPTEADEAEFNAAINRKIGYVLSCALVGEDGARLYADADAALGAIPLSKWSDAIEVFGEVMRASGLSRSEATDEKNG